ncbi:MAG: hypothetical protein QW505_05825 [Thermoplasmata archaeon]
MRKPISSSGFDIYFRSSLVRARKKTGARKRHPIGARSARRARQAPVRISDIGDDEMAEPSVTPKDERKIWD